MGQEDVLYYAMEVKVGQPRQVVRFSHKANRALWLRRDTVNRSIVMKNAPMLLAMAARGVTWEYIDGVSYAR